MSDIYKLQYDGMTLAYPGWNGYMCYEKQAGYPITYLSDEHVSITGDSIYIPGSEGITLQSSYDTYYRISGYDITNGSIVDGKLVPTGPCTIKAVQKVNAFTATGGWEKGSNVSAHAGKNSQQTKNIPAKYAIYGSHTGDIPTAWYNTSNRWKINSTVSGYQITLHPVMKLSAYRGNGGSLTNKYTAVSLIGSTQTQTETGSLRSTQAIEYNKTFTSNITGVNYGISGSMYVKSTGGYIYAANMYYFATGTTGTWTATGYAP